MRVLAVLMALGSVALSGADEVWVKEMLARPVLGPKQSTVEVQAYAASRVAAMPPVKSRAEWEAYAASLRTRILRDVVLRGEAAKWAAYRGRVEWLATLPGDGYRVKKLRFEAAPGFWIPALLYEPASLSGKTAAVLNLNGHEGQGKATPYIQARCINLAKRGVLALNPEWVGKGELSAPGYAHARMNQLELSGTSGLSIFYLTMKRALDILLEHPQTDPARVAATGLSGGGWQTILISALDPRIRAAAPVAGYSSYVTRAQWPELDLGDSEQTPTDLASFADYTHLTALMAPRPLMLVSNARDNCCFRADYAVAPLMREASPIYRLFGGESKLRYHLNFDAGHNYGADNREAFYRFLKEHFYAADARFPVEDFRVDRELRSEAELRVELPDGSLDLHTLALRLAEKVSPGTAGVAEIFRIKPFATRAQRVHEGAGIRHWMLVLNETWSVPVVEFNAGQGGAAVLAVADEGRVALAPRVTRWVNEGRRVLAMDPLYYGEAKFAMRDYLFALLLAGIGDRIAGIQAAQIAAVAQWAGTPVEMVSVGPRAGFAAAAAAAWRPALFTRFVPEGGWKTTREILTQDLPADKQPEFFVFDLFRVAPPLTGRQ